MRRNQKALGKFQNATLKLISEQITLAELCADRALTESSQSSYQNGQRALAIHGRIVRLLHNTSLKPKDAQRISLRLTDLRSKLLELGQEVEGIAIGLAASEEANQFRVSDLPNPNQLEAEFQNQLIQFIAIEIDISMTFVESARSSREPERLERNTNNAYTGYKTILHFLGDKHLSKQRADELRPAIRQLEELLVTLGKPTKPHPV